MSNQLIINWLGHANVFIKGRVNVLIDPFFCGNPFAPDWRSLEKVDLIMITHGHGDHLGQCLEIATATKATVACMADLADWLRGEGLPAEQIINHGSGGNIDGGFTFKNLRVMFTQAIHSCPYSSPCGFVLQTEEGPCLYHAGDSALFSDMRLIGERFPIDLAMLPIGGAFTMDGEQAAKALKLLRPKKALPIHYKTFDVLAQSADAFINASKVEVPDCEIIALNPGDSLSLCLT